MITEGRVRKRVNFNEGASMRFRRWLGTAVLGVATLALLPDTAPAAYVVTALVTNASDPDLVNPWGISFTGSSPFWVSDNGTGKATLYNSAGVKQGLIVSMPVGSEPITGQVFNGTANFRGDTFLFASENGTIAGWRGSLGTVAEQLYGVSGAVYKGLAISAAKDRLFAANFHDGTIDVFDSSHTSPIGSFSDPTAPAGYAPFNVQNVGGTFYVTFALQDAAKHDDVAGTGNGIIDRFDPATDTFTRLVTGSSAGGTATALDSPWGVAVAPGGFGEFGGALLVGNFGNGEINAFDPVTGAFRGTLRDSANSPIAAPGLWGLTFGNGGNGGAVNSLYITAGGENEDTGLFARIDPAAAAAPEPASLTLLATGALGLLGYAWRRRKGA